MAKYKLPPGPLSEEERKKAIAAWDSGNGHLDWNDKGRLDLERSKKEMEEDEQDFTPELLNSLVNSPKPSEANKDQNLDGATNESVDQLEELSEYENVFGINDGKRVSKSTKATIPEQDIALLREIILDTLNNIEPDKELGDISSRVAHVLKNVLGETEEERSKDMFVRWIAYSDSDSGTYEDMEALASKAKLFWDSLARDTKAKLIEISEIFDIAREQTLGSEYPCALYSLIKEAKINKDKPILAKNAVKFTVLRRWLPKEYERFIDFAKTSILRTHSARNKFTEEVIRCFSQRYPDVPNDVTTNDTDLGKTKKCLDVLGCTPVYDMFSDKYKIMEPSGVKTLSDKLLLEIWGLAIEKQKCELTRNVFREYLEVIALRRKVHPVREYLGSLAWDGVPRIDNLCNVYLGVQKRDEKDANGKCNIQNKEYNEYISAVGRLILIAAVRRIMQPGCKFDEILLIEGPQGCGKSKFVRALATRDEWFTDNVTLKHDTKKLMEDTLGKWIVELSEMKGIRKSGTDHTKSTLSKQEDSSRLAYDRYRSDALRQFVFIGTINVTNDKDSYLMDTTGNRRYWIVKAGDINLELLNEDIDQLWAEATFRENQGESIELSKELWAAAKREQDSRQKELTFQSQLEDQLGDLGNNIIILVDDVKKLLGIQAKDWHSEKDMGMAMAALGYEKDQFQRRGNKKRRVYYYKGEKCNTAAFKDYAVREDLRSKTLQIVQIDISGNVIEEDLGAPY